MIVTEYFETRQDGVKLYRTYDDEDYRIMQEQTGAVYDEAIDVEGAGYTYIATQEKREAEPILEPEPALSAEAALRIILGEG